MNDEIVDEVRQNRSEILESFGGDIEKMLRAMIAKQEQSGHTLVVLEQKEPQEGVALDVYPLPKKAQGS